ncbi:MAG: phospholipase D-like domain-containing protein [Halieaceae bacterium]|uniref:phospholipase D-like domain-containing protein n=1 Tax=Haliea alexandrii TaxID=2448162 RepID=UPI000F0B72CE|nr:phospholipase D-like domain-containing protein [Haliea alexandrii]MCR9186631.1 phospholipase D-like domain-containing protein [Halieaceae bacterium]
MQVMYWQILVIGSMAGAYLLVSRQAALWVGAGWTVWTLAMLNYEPLIMVQLASTWGTFFVVGRLKTSSTDLAQAREKLAGFEAATAGFSGQVRDLARSAESHGKVTPLQDSEHYEYLLRAIKESKKSLLILSGWLSSSVVDETFCVAIRDALSRGVNVYLGFGYENSGGQHEASPKSHQAMNSLRAVADAARGMEGVLKVGEFNNHQKILIRDCEEVVCGSHNWLSNRAFMNREKSFVVDDPNVARQAFAECRPLIEGNLKI